MDNLDAELTKTRNRLQVKEDEAQRLTIALAASEVERNGLSRQLGETARETRAAREEFETKLGEAKDNLEVNDWELRRVRGSLEAANAELEALAAQSKLRWRALTAAHAEMERMKHAHGEENDRLRELFRPIVAIPFGDTGSHLQ